MPKKSVFLSIGGEENKLKILESARALSAQGFEIYATEGTAKYLQEHGVKNTRLYKISEKSSPSILDKLQKGEIDLAINISLPHTTKGETDGFLIRRSCIDLGIPLITNPQSAELLVTALTTKRVEDLEIKSWDEYVGS